MTHQHPVRIYYEDTDHSGLVYHANYLKYFERAREHLLGPDTLVDLLAQKGLGFVVYRCELRFREGAVFGDELTIATAGTLQSPWRAVFSQRVLRGERLLVEGTVEMVCVDAEKKLVRIPDEVVARVGATASEAR